MHEFANEMYAPTKLEIYNPLKYGGIYDILIFTGGKLLFYIKSECEILLKLSFNWKFLLIN